MSKKPKPTKSSKRVISDGKKALASSLKREYEVHSDKIEKLQESIFEFLSDPEIPAELRAFMATDIAGLAGALAVDETSVFAFAQEAASRMKVWKAALRQEAKKKTGTPEA